MSRIAKRVKDALARLKPRWAWVCLTLGFPWLLTPLSCKANPSGCLGALSALSFWVGFSVIAFFGFRWLWGKLLFRVSRRLWLILLLVSFLPAFTLTVFFLSLGWMGLGAQVSRSIQGTLRNHEAALQSAAEEPGDTRALKILQGFGRGYIQRMKTLPPGTEPDKALLVYAPNPADPEDRDLYLRIATPIPGGYRVLSLDLQRLSEQGRSLWGGKAEYRVLPSREKALHENDPKGTALQIDDADLLGSSQSLETWEQGEVAEGGLFLRAFPLPPVSLRAQDWESGQFLLLRIRPITSLQEIFMGYGFGQGNLSARSLLVILALVASLLFLAVLQFIALFTGLYLARKLGQSVDGLFRGVRRLAQGDFSVRIQPRGQDQVARLTGAFNEMAERLEAADAEREERARLEEELRVAREVQMRLLPDVAPLAPHIQAIIYPAREVAGDYFDLFALQDGRYAFFIADVSGKGTSAAFYAAETKGFLAALDKEALGPKDVLIRLNTLWCEARRSRLFLTAIYGTFHPATGAFAFARAGHPAALLRRSDGRVERRFPKGLGIGLSAAHFATHLELDEGCLDVGDSLILYTDGITEAMKAHGEFFGETRLVETLSASGAPHQLILSAVDAFLEGGVPEDDLTLLTLQR